jgi:hypothetical protein
MSALSAATSAAGFQVETFTFAFVGDSGTLGGAGGLLGGPAHRGLLAHMCRLGLLSCAYLPSMLALHGSDDAFTPSQRVLPRHVRTRGTLPARNSWWQFEAGAGGLKPFFDNIDEHQRTSARQTMADSISRYRTVTGSYQLPPTCRIITAR